MRYLTVSLVAMLAACSTDGVIETPGAGSGPATPADVGAPRSWPVAPDASVVEVEATDARTGTMAAELTITGGQVTLEAGLLSALDLSLADVVIPPEMFPPHGLALADVSVTLTSFEPVEPGVRRDGAPAPEELKGIATLRLEWSMVTRNGLAHVLQPQAIDGVHVTVAIDNGNLVVGLSRPGAFWTWAGLLQLGELGATLRTEG